MKKQALFFVAHDDHLTRSLINEGLKRAFPGCVVREFKSERELRERLFEPGITGVIMGACLRWCFPSANMAIPPDLAETGYAKGAAWRCWQMLRANPATAQTPLLVWEFSTLMFRATPPEDRATTYLDYRVECLLEAISISSAPL